MKRKLIATNLELTSALERRLNAICPDYVLKSQNVLGAKDLGQVEIILIDIMGANGKGLIAKVSDMPRLKMIQSLRAGADSVDFSSIPQEIIYCGNIGAYSLPMGEFTMGMILYLAKYLSLRNEKLRNGEPDYRNSILLNGRKIGIIGAGGIGQEVSKLAKCLGMITIGVNTSGKSSPMFDKMYRTSGIDSVLKMSDVVVLALPLNVNTFHIINKKRLRLMKKDCILVNVGRGYLIDEKALYDHLLKNPDFKCGLDVWWHYPKPGEKFVQRFQFVDLPNFLGTPHVSGFVPEEREISIQSALDNIQRYVRGKKLKGVINREDYTGLSQLITRTKTS